MVSAVLRKTVSGASPLYDGPVRYGPVEYGDFVRGTGGKSAIHHLYGAAAESDLLPVELRHADLGYFPQPVPEDLQTL